MMDYVILVLVGGPIGLFLLFMVFSEIRDNFLDSKERKKAQKEEYKELARLKELKEDLDKRSKEIEQKEEEIALEQKGIEKTREDFSKEWKKIKEARAQMYSDQKDLNEQVLALQVYQDELIAARDEVRLGKYEVKNIERKNIKNHPTLGTIGDDQSLWNINPLFFTPEQRAKYIEAFDKPITKRALSEPIFVRLAYLDKSNTPYAAYGYVNSIKFDSDEVHDYTTSLTSCNCPYHKKYGSICKHMMALAIKVGAVTVDVEEVLNRD